MSEMKSYLNVQQCRVCESKNLQEVYKFAPVPLVNNYCSFTKHQEHYFPLTLIQCCNCGLAQLLEQVHQDVLYAGDYSYIPSTARTMVDHFDSIAERFAKPGAVVLDIGSNDGTLLKGFKARGCDVIGIEPANNLCKIANDAGIPTVQGFFNESWTMGIQFDVITATNVVANANNISSILRGVRQGLVDDGIFVMENPNFLNLMKIGSFDTIYHEHFVYFTPNTARFAFESHGLEVIAIEEVPVHGGSLRVIAKKGEINKPELPIDDLTPFANTTKDRVEQIHSFFRAASAGKFRVIGFGAPAKATILLHQAEIESHWMEYIVDTVPFKQGKFLPGKHIPILAPEILNGDRPDYIFVNSWNFREEILPKLELLRKKRSKVVFPIPEMEIM